MMGLEFARLWGLTESKTNDIIKLLIDVSASATEIEHLSTKRIGLGADTLDSVRFDFEALHEKNFRCV